MEDMIDFDSGEAKFNMALACLERVDKKIQHYTDVSAYPLAYVKSCKLKSKLLRQLFMIAVPLMIDKTKQRDIRDRLDNIDKSFISAMGSGFGRVSMTESCPINTEDLLDCIFEDLQELLQDEKKIFMPGKGESALF